MLILLLYPLLIALPGAAVYGLLAARLPAMMTAMPLLTALGLGLALWPILLLYTTLLHIPAGSIWLYALLLISALIIYRQRRQFHLQPPRLETGLLGVALLTSLVVRLYAIRDLVAPLYGDSVHHTIVTQLIADRGGVPTDYLPYIPLTSFTYHFGFHTQAALAMWAAGLDAPTAVLYIGQALNALTVLAAYYLSAGLFYPARWAKWAGLVSALLTGLVSVMPDYYFNWGRYTQLAGQATLPFAMLALVALAQDVRSLRQRGPLILLNILLIVGLFLSHYRVLIFYAAWVLVVIIWRILSPDLALPLADFSLDEANGEEGRAGGINQASTPPLVPARMPRPNLKSKIENLKSGLLIGLGALLLAAPWLLNLVNNYFGGLVDRLKNISDDYLASYNTGSLLGELDIWLIVPAGLAIVLALVLCVATWKQAGLRPLHLGAAAVGLWVGALYLIANPYIGKFRLPGAGAVNNFAVGIMLYIPAALLIGYLVGWLLNLVGNIGPLPKSNLPRYILAAVYVVACAGLMFADNTGTQGTGLFTVKGPDSHSIIVAPADVAAIRWLGQHSAAGDKVLIAAVPANEFRGQAVVGIDGGMWVAPLAAREVSAPPLVAGNERTRDSNLQQHIHDLTLAAWPLTGKKTLYNSTTPNPLPDASTFAALQQAGITLLYSAANSQFWRLDYLNRDTQHFARVYNEGGVQIFRIKY